jgi:alkylation response protein AidB-like acyl-CoA dehydrogenase
MDIDFTPEQERYRRDFRRWLDENLPEDWGGPAYLGPDDADENAMMQAAWERKLYAAGYQGVAWPKAYGGQGLTMVEQLIVSEELGRRAAPEGINTIGKELVAPIILAAGTEAQKKHYVPRILTLDDIWCQGFSEPDAGSDLAGVRTRAVRDGGSWVLNGQKVWTSFAVHANWCILLARTNPDVSKHRGLTLFLVDMKTPGITVRPLVQITGRQEFNEVFFDNARIPADMHVGAVDDGWNVAVNLLGYERATARLYRQARFMNEFEQLLRKIGDRPEVAVNAHYRQQIGRFYAELGVLRQLNLKTVSRIVNGDGIGSDASVVKLFWSELHQRIEGFAMEVLGPDYVADSVGIERFRYNFLQARAVTIYAGTSQVQRNIIAERMLGLPR